VQNEPGTVERSFKGQYVPDRASAHSTTCVSTVRLPVRKALKCSHNFSSQQNIFLFHKIVVEAILKENIFLFHKIAVEAI
jgi:hypothetical protein